MTLTIARRPHAASPGSHDTRAAEDDVPWILWAIEHPAEANAAEHWLDTELARRVADPDELRWDTGFVRPAATEARRGRSVTALLARWTGQVTMFVIVLLLAVAAFLAYGRLDNRWYHLVTVDGGSMEPTYSVGDVLILTRPPETIEVGMVVTMQVDGQIVTHRVVQILPDGGFVTQGDANDAPDDFEGLDVRIVGLVRAHLPWIGNVVGAARSSAWFVDSAASTAIVEVPAPAATRTATPATPASGPVDAITETADDPTPTAPSGDDRTSGDPDADPSEDDPVAEDPIEDPTEEIPAEVASDEASIAEDPIEIPTEGAAPTAQPATQDDPHQG